MTEQWTLAELVSEVATRIAALPAPKNGQVRAVPDDRTVRYYATLGLLDRPDSMRGRTAIYGRKHLAQIVAIKRMQTMGRSLAEIQALWPTMDDQTLGRMAGIALPITIGRAPSRQEFWKREPTAGAATSTIGEREAAARVGRGSTIGEREGVGRGSTVGERESAAGVGASSTIGERESAAGVGRGSTIGEGVGAGSTIGERESAGVERGSTIGEREGVGAGSTIRERESAADDGTRSTIGDSDLAAAIGDGSTITERESAAGATTLEHDLAGVRPGSTIAELDAADIDREPDRGHLRARSLRSRHAQQAPIELRIELAPNVSLVLAVVDEHVSISPADVRAIRAAAAPLIAELAQRRLTTHAGGEP